jgi:asparagine synthase (glutamine-hydrolysing)
MCGIYATFGKVPNEPNLAHRGPDDYGHASGNTPHPWEMSFWRLAINGTAGPNQPIEYDGLKLVCNGEIYNHLELGGHRGESDCNVILPTIEREGLTRACELFSGDFAFVYTDGERYWAARDRVGVRPLFYVRHDDGMAFASEAKALLQFKRNIRVFPPGHVYDSELDKFICWAPNYWDHPREDTPFEDIKFHLREYFLEAVRKRVETTERPVGFFLSGGLDSSLVAWAGAKILAPKRIKTFAIGCGDSPDLKAAREMAKFLNSEHTEVTFSIPEAIERLHEVMWALESWDVTTVRASVPMFLLAEWIKRNSDVRVVLSGEGSDELFGGYLYFHNAPDLESYRAETIRLVQDVHLFDVLRADRCTAAHGIELRVPFFDRDFIDYAMDGFSTVFKYQNNGLEKWILRETFKDDLPPSICWRQKNGMSDAVGYSWVDALREKFGGREEIFYKKVFEQMFGREQCHLTPYQWLPKWTTVKDPSARLLDGIFNAE